MSRGLLKRAYPARVALISIFLQNIASNQTIISASKKMCHPWFRSRRGLFGIRDSAALSLASKQNETPNIPQAQISGGAVSPRRDRRAFFVPIASVVLGCAVSCSYLSNESRPQKPVLVLDSRVKITKNGLPGADRGWNRVHAVRMFTIAGKRPHRPPAIHLP